MYLYVWVIRLYRRKRFQIWVGLSIKRLAENLQLKALLSGIEGVWEESQNNKKVLRLNGGVMNWYESTGTIYFQGVAEGKRYL